MVDNDFSYKVKSGDVSRLKILSKEEYFGYDHVEPTVFKREIVNLKDEIYNEKELMNYLDFDNGFVNSWYVKKNNYKWKELGINLQKVQFIKPGFNLGKDGFLGKTIKEFYHGLDFDYPTKLPIYFVDDFQKTSFKADYLEFSNHNSIIYNSILLPKVDRKICNSIYAHEITHIEQENVGGVKKITNIETLPVLIELLFADKTDIITRKKILNHRLIYLAGTIVKLLKEKDINYALRIKLETYLISIIQGIELFNKYNDGNELIKKEMIDYINEIFLGDNTIENMLDKYESNYNEVNLKLKSLKR